MIEDEPGGCARHQVARSSLYIYDLENLEKEHATGLKYLSVADSLNRQLQMQQNQATTNVTTEETVLQKHLTIQDLERQLHYSVSYEICALEARRIQMGVEYAVKNDACGKLIDEAKKTLGKVDLDLERVRKK